MIHMVEFTAKNTVISPDFLLLKFCGKTKFPHSFGQITRNYEETEPFRKISTPGNQGILRYFSQWLVHHNVNVMQYILFNFFWICMFVLLFQYYIICYKIFTRRTILLFIMKFSGKALVSRQNRFFFFCEWNRCIWRSRWW